MGNGQQWVQRGVAQRVCYLPNQSVDSVELRAGALAQAFGFKRKRQLAGQMPFQITQSSSLVISPQGAHPPSLVNLTDVLVNRQCGYCLTNVFDQSI